MNKILIVIITTLILLTCQKKTTITDNALEEDVFYYIFPALIDSIHYDFRLLPPPPPPPSYIDESGKKIVIDSLLSKSLHTKAVKKWQKIKEEILKDTTSAYLIVPDSITSIDKEDFSKLISHFKRISIDSNEINLETGYKIDINRLHTNYKKLKFRYLSEVSNKKGDWNKVNDNYISAYLNFTKILFDKTKNYGVFNISHVRGRLDGNGSRIYIKKNKHGKWVIDKIEGTWIS